MSHPDATVKLSVEHIRLFGGMDVKRSNVVRVPPPLAVALAVNSRAVGSEASPRRPESPRSAPSRMSKASKWAPWNWGASADYAWGSAPSPIATAHFRDAPSVCGERSINGSTLWLRPASRFDRHFQTHRTRLGWDLIPLPVVDRGPHVVISYAWAGVAQTFRSDQIH